MAALFETAPPVVLVSLEEYHRQPEYNANGRRTELLRGVVIEKVSKSPRHSSLQRRMLRWVEAAAGPGTFVMKDEPLTLVDSEPEPDISVITGKEADYDLHHPATALLAIEVAVTSLAQDRQKAALYAEAGIPEYWIVLANEEAIEVHTAPQGGRYTQRRVYRGGETLASAALPALRVDLAALFAVG